MENEKERSEIKKELQEIAPKLGALQKPDRHSFSVPENYFEEFSFHIKDKIDARKAARGMNWADFQKYLFPQFAPALAILVVIILAGFFMLWRNTENITASQVNSADKTNEFYIENIDEDLLVETLLNEKTAATNEIEENTAKTNSLENFIIENYEESTLTEGL